MDTTSSSLKVVAISGSPSTSSKTALLTDAIMRRLEAEGIEVQHRRVAAIPADALLAGRMEDPQLAEMAAVVEAAHGIIIATPIYKASYSGLLKCFLDVLPQFAFAGKAVLPIGTGGTLAHVLALDYALRPVLQSMGARHIVQSHFVAEATLVMRHGVLEVDEPNAAPLWEAVRHFARALSDAPYTRQLGHPRPVAAP